MRQPNTWISIPVLSPIPSRLGLIILGGLQYMSSKNSTGLESQRMILIRSTPDTPEFSEWLHRPFNMPSQRLEVAHSTPTTDLGDCPWIDRQFPIQPRLPGHPDTKNTDSYFEDTEVTLISLDNL